MSIEGLLVFLLIGEIAGWMTGVILRGGYNIIGDIIFGILGSLTGTFVFSLFDTGAFNLIGSIIVAFIGGVALVFLMRTVSKVIA